MTFALLLYYSLQKRVSKSILTERPWICLQEIVIFFYFILFYFLFIFKTSWDTIRQHPFNITISQSGHHLASWSLLALQIDIEFAIPSIVSYHTHITLHFYQTRCQNITDRSAKTEKVRLLSLELVGRRTISCSDKNKKYSRRIKQIQS